MNSVVEVLTISVGSESEMRHPFFLTVADIDWPGLLAHFSEPVVTKDGEDTRRCTSMAPSWKCSMT